MTTEAESPIRSLALSAVHRWQKFYDLSRGKWRKFSFRSWLETTWSDFRDRRRALGQTLRILEDVYGIRFVLYPWDRRNLLHLFRRTHDAAEFQVIPGLVRPGDIAVDVGANAGVYSVLFSRLCGPTGRVWAFEPVPDTYWRLRETLALNRCENVSALQAAICDQSGDVRINLFDREFSELNTLGVPIFRGPNGEKIAPKGFVEVQALTLDDFCRAEGIERINFLKVDVEGFEVSVFRGAERLLREHRVDYICFEISQEPLKGAGFSSRDVFAALAGSGYASYHVDKSGQFTGPIMDSSESWTNYFASWRDVSDWGGVFESDQHSSFENSSRTVAK